MGSSKTKKFSGELAKPIIWDPPIPGILDMDSDGVTEEFSRRRKEAIAKLATMKLRKLKLLIEHYNLAHESADLWPLYLAHKLADDFVPGFKVISKKKKGGRPPRWKNGGYLQLLVDVEKIKREKKCGDRVAIRAMKNRVATKERYARDTIDGLENRLSEARNPKHNILASILYHDDKRLQKIAMDSLLKSLGSGSSLDTFPET